MTRQPFDFARDRFGAGHGHFKWHGLPGVITRVLKCRRVDDARIDLANVNVAQTF